MADQHMTPCELIRRDLAVLEEYASRLTTQLRAIEGRAEVLRAKLLDVDGAHDQRPVAVR